MAFAEGSSTDIGDSDLSADDISQEKISMGEKKKHAETEKEKVEKKSETVVSDAQMAEYSVQFVLNTSQVTADKDWYNNVITRIGNPAFTVTIDDTAYTAPAEAYHQMAEKAEGDYCAFIEAGDVISENLAEILTNGITICPGHHAYMVAKTFANATKGAFRNFLKVTDSKKELKPFYVIDLKNKYDCYPFTFAGTILKTDILKKRNVNASLGLEMERDFFLRYLAEEMKVVYLPGVEYTAYEYEEHDITFYRGLYMQEWYFDSITEFWMPFLTEMKEKYGDKRRTEIIQGTFDIESIFNLTAGLKWSFANDRMSLSARCNDILNTGMPKTKVRFKGQDLDMNSAFHSRAFTLNLSYRFGGYKKKNLKEVDTSRFGM